MSLSLRDIFTRAQKSMNRTLPELERETRAEIIQGNVYESADARAIILFQQAQIECLRRNLELVAAQAGIQLNYELQMPVFDAQLEPERPVEVFTNFEKV